MSSLCFAKGFLLFINLFFSLFIKNHLFSCMKYRKCVPQCPLGCVNGYCVSPGHCNCSFGWTGSDCKTVCKCNGHSNCANETHTDVCLKCHNDTQVSATLILYISIYIMAKNIISVS